jgi:hypothetical protein
MHCITAGGNGSGLQLSSSFLSSQDGTPFQTFITVPITPPRSPSAEPVRTPNRAGFFLRTSASVILTTPNRAGILRTSAFVVLTRDNYRHCTRRCCHRPFPYTMYRSLRINCFCTVMFKCLGWLWVCERAKFMSGINVQRVEYYSKAAIAVEDSVCMRRRNV